jgi:hypothetical protein
MARAGALLCCLLIGSSAAAQTLTPQQIEDAIAAGRNKKERQLVFTCPAVIGFGAMFRGEKAGINQTGAYAVTVSLPTGRIAQLSAAAERFYKHLEPDAVPADLRTMAVIVTAEPGEPIVSSAPTRSASVAAPIQQMVIRDFPWRHDIVRPDTLKLDPVQWSNVLGTTVNATRAEARFPLGAVRELTTGELEIILVTTAGERSCSMPERDRKRIFGQ